MKTILISAGHGASDPGACANGYSEAAIALIFRDGIAVELRRRGLSVLTDGADGINEPLTKAIALAKACSGAAVELHLNASPNKTATGVEALALPIYSRLAQNLAKMVAHVLNIPLRGEKGWKSDSAGQHHRLGFCQAGGVVLELCFISNETDIETLMANKADVIDALADVLEIHSKE